MVSHLEVAFNLTIHEFNKTSYAKTKALVPLLPWGAFWEAHLLPARLFSKNLFIERIQIAMNDMKT